MSNSNVFSSFFTHKVMLQAMPTEIEVILTEYITDYILCPVEAEDSGIENTELVTGK